VKIKEITTKAQRMECGEGPHWDIARQSLYFVDILDPAVFRYDTKSGKIYKATIKDDDSTISFIIPVENTTDEFVIGANRRLLLIHWNGKSSRVKVLKSLVEVDHAHTGNRINDGKVDPKGVLFFGSMGDESKFNLFETNVGTFYRFTNGTGARALKTNVGISNGLTWDAECRKFYYIDSVARDVKKFDYDPETSEICELHQRVLNESHKFSLCSQ
jgi:sugar lactone lactonase YvrE